MRTELEKIELIEKYILKTLSAEEISAFEKMRNNGEITAEHIEEIRNTIKAIQNHFIQQEIVKSSQKFNFIKSIKTISIIAFITCLAILSAIYISEKKTTEKQENTKIIQNKTEINLPKIDENEIDTPELKSIIGFTIPNVFFSKNEKSFDNNPFEEINNNIKSKINLPSKYFEIDNTKDTVISTQNLIVYIPANAFKNEDGNTPKIVNFEMKEAVEAADIMKAGLSTEGENGLLETAGMFYINANEDNKYLEIVKKITVQVASENVDEEMKLFEGEEQADGKILWKNPQHISNNPLPIDMNLLDFYPPNYLDTLAANNKEFKNKKHTDSLYYSFAYLFGKDEIVSDEEFLEKDTKKQKNNLLPKVFGDRRAKKQELNNGDSVVMKIKGINPAYVKAFWNKEYNNTLLATKEFEERMYWIHQSCDAEILRLYVNNLDKNFYEIDALAAKKASGKSKEKFKAFANQKIGKVEIDKNRSEALSRFYKRTSEDQINIATKVYSKYQQELQNLRTELQKQKSIQSQNESKRKYENFEKEFELNVKEAYNQAGLPNPKFTRKGRRGYTISFSRGGWYNLDKYVFNATINRETMDINWNGKRVKLTYEKIEINLTETFEKTFCYLLPTELNSFERMNKVSDNKFSFSMNMLLKYDLCIVAYKDGKWYEYTEKNMQKGSITVQGFKALDENELNDKFANRNNISVVTKLMDDINFNRFEVKQSKEISDRETHLLFLEKIKKTIFPCYEGVKYSEERPPEIIENIIEN